MKNKNHNMALHSNQYIMIETISPSTVMTWKDLFLVLWRKRNIPMSMPIAPPMKLIMSRVASLTRHSSFFALLLSHHIVKKASILTKIR
jgi:hypothetical protein